jgi:uncharacterized membrane protein YphA (DoxX/SURF4 family)
MAHRKTRKWTVLLGLAFAIAGADKLFAVDGYRRLFRQWGWSQQAMRGIGAGEVVGGVLLGCPAAQRLGGLVLTTICSAVLTAELQRGEAERAVPRSALLLVAAISALQSAPPQRAVRVRTR